MTYTVTQYAREAAEGLHGGFCNAFGPTPMDCSCGVWEAFAKFEAETLERAEAIVENCGDMCCGCLDAIRNLKGKSDE